MYRFGIKQLYHTYETYIDRKRIVFPTINDFMEFFKSNNGIKFLREENVYLF